MSTYNFTAKRGDTLTATFQFFTDTTESEKEDITEDTFKMQIINTLGEVAHTFTMDDELSVNENGDLVLSVSPLDIPADTYYYDLERTKADGTIITAPEGTFTVTPDKTI